MFFFIATLATVLMAIYIIHYLILPLSISTAGKMFLSAFILIASQKMGLFWLLGNLFPFMQTRGIMIFFGILQAWIFVLFIGALFLNVLSLFKVFIPGALPVVLIFSLLVAVWGVWQGLKVPSVRHVSLSFSQLPDGWQELRIVQLTDLHIGSGFDGKWLAQVVEKTNALHPDLIVITGDMIDGSPQKLLSELQPFKKLKAKYGILAVLGNHEYYYGAKRWLSPFKELGLDVLSNEARLFSHADHSFAVGGLPMTNALRYGMQNPNIVQTFQNIPTDIPRFLLAHYPAQVSLTRQAHVLLQLSGHTHGGQIFYPFNLLTAAANKGFVKGIYRIGATTLYVSSGTGLWGGFPVRLGTRPEITLLTIQKAPCPSA